MSPLSLTVEALAALLLWGHGYVSGRLREGGETWRTWVREEWRALKSEPDETLRPWVRKVREWYRALRGWWYGE